MALASNLIAEKKYDQALGCLDKAEDKGSVQALRAKAYIYTIPDNPAHDFQKAVAFFSQAADRGDVVSQFMLASYLDQGDVIPKNEKEACKWLKLSANGGYSRAQVRLAELYEKGVPDVLAKDPVAAYDLYCKAMNTALREPSTVVDVKDLLVRINVLKQSLSPEDIRQADTKTKQNYTDPLPDWVDNHRQQLIATGSGFIITKSGYVISNHHVIRGGTSIMLKTAFGKQPATVVDVDVENDLSLLKIDGAFPVAAPVANSDNNAYVGQSIFVYGYPSPGKLGQEEPKYVEGNITAKDFVRGLEGADNARNLGITAMITHGNSGSAVFDKRGNALGVVVTLVNEDVQGDIYRTQQAIKSSRLLDFLKKHPEVEKAMGAPVVWDRPFEDVVAEARQEVVLIGQYQSLHDYLLESAPETGGAVRGFLFQKNTGLDPDATANREKYAKFARELDPSILEETFKGYLRQQAMHAGWQTDDLRDGDVEAAWRRFLESN